MARKSKSSDYLYKIIGTLFGVASFTAAPFLVFMWVGFTPPALILVPIATTVSFKIGKELYDLAEEAESSYIETLQSLFVAIVVLIILVGIGFEIHDWIVKQILP